MTSFYKGYYRFIIKLVISFYLAGIYLNIFNKILILIIFNILIILITEDSSCMWGILLIMKNI